MSVFAIPDRRFAGLPDDERKAQTEISMSTWMAPVMLVGNLLPVGGAAAVVSLRFTPRRNSLASGLMGAGRELMKVSGALPFRGCNPAVEQEVGAVHARIG